MLIHTVLFMLKENTIERDLSLVYRCFKTLEKSTYKKVLVYNQGYWSNVMVGEYLHQFDLECIVIGSDKNVGIVAGRQAAFEYVFENISDVRYVSELHLDMAFGCEWENPLVQYLESNDHEPMICCGIVQENKIMPSISLIALSSPPHDLTEMDDYLDALKRDKIVNGLVHPCIHKVEMLKAVGGFDTKFLSGMQAFEDDSLLVGYHYYIGRRYNWRPKINYNSVCVHDVAAQRSELKDDVMINYYGLLSQYGAESLNVLSKIHNTEWNNKFFAEQYEQVCQLAQCKQIYQAADKLLINK